MGETVCVDFLPSEEDHKSYKFHDFNRTMRMRLGFTSSTNVTQASDLNPVRLFYSYQWMIAQ